jgi:hypothetical protein
MCIGDEWPDEAKTDCINILDAIDSFTITYAPVWYVEGYNDEAHDDADDEFVDFVESELGGYSRVDSRFEKNKQDKNLYIYSEDSANIEAVTHAIHAVQRHYQIETPITFSFADTCSKPRVGEFGGGVVTITRDRIETWHTSEGIPTVGRVCMKHSGSDMSKLALVLSGKAEHEFIRYVRNLGPAEKQRFWSLLGKGDYRQYRKDTLRYWLYADKADVDLIKNSLGQVDESLYRYIRFGREYDDYEMKGTFENRFRLDFKISPERVILYDIPE